MRDLTDGVGDGEGRDDCGGDDDDFNSDALAGSNGIGPEGVRDFPDGPQGFRDLWVLFEKRYVCGEGEAEVPPATFPAAADADADAAADAPASGCEDADVSSWTSSSKTTASWS